MEDLVVKVKKVLEDKVSPDLKRPFFDGDPIFVSKSHLPTIAVMMEDEDIDTGGTGCDRRLYTLTIKVIVNKENDFNKAPAQVVAHKTLRDFVEGIEGDNIKENSIVSILRKNFTLSSEVLNQLVKVVYNTIDRKDVITEECWISFSVEKLVEVSGRS